MGCDIQSFVEVRNNGEWKEVDTDWYKWRDYSVFAFLADVRNYSHIKPISDPRGLPEDVSNSVLREYEDARGWVHTPTYLTLSELLAHDYDQVFWDRRVTKQIGERAWTGAGLAEEGEGSHLSVREFLGEFFFKEVERLKEYGDLENVRVVFWFDN